MNFVISEVRLANQACYGSGLVNSCSSHQLARHHNTMQSQLQRRVWIKGLVAQPDDFSSALPPSRRALGRCTRIAVCSLVNRGVAPGMDTVRFPARAGPDKCFQNFYSFRLSLGFHLGTCSSVSFPSICSTNE